MEARAARDDGLAVFSDLGIQDFRLRVVARLDSVLGTDVHAAAAADAAAMVDGAFLVLNDRGAVRADLLAGAAADAEALVNGGLFIGVHFHLARAGAAAHAEVLQRAAEAGGLVALEVGEGDDDVGVHQGAADLGRGTVLRALDRDFHLIRALQAIGDDDVAARGERGEAVGIGGVHMLERMLAAADVERVAVGQEGTAAQFLDEVGHGLGIVRPQIGQIAELAEVHLDGDEFILKIDLVHAGLQQKLAQLLLLVQAGMAAEVGEIYWTGVHNSASIFYRYAVILAKFLQTVKLRPRRSCQNAEDLQFVNCQARQCD